MTLEEHFKQYASLVLVGSDAPTTELDEERLRLTFYAGAVVGSLKLLDPKAVLAEAYSHAAIAKALLASRDA